MSGLDRGRIEKHYAEVCERVHLPKDLYELSVEQENRKSKLLFQKSHYRKGKYIERFGKNIIVTDHMDWTTDEIVKASLDRYMVAKAFRQAKDDDLASILPLRHWTDGKIRCHILTCVAVLTYLRIIESRLNRAGLKVSAATAIKQMERLHSCLYWTTKKGNPARLIEEPTEIQTKIIKAFGYKLESGVLQRSN